jgi:hypothetical protein
MYLTKSLPKMVNVVDDYNFKHILIDCKINELKFNLLITNVTSKSRNLYPFNDHNVHMKINSEQKKEEGF